MRRAIMVIVAASAVWAQAAQAQKADAPLLPAGVTALDPPSGPATDRYRFQSKKAEKPFIIYVTRVDSGGFSAPTSQDARLPVVFVTDAGAGPDLVSVLASVGAFAAQLPAMIVVGIGQDTSSAKSPAEAARRDWPSA